MKFFIVTVCLNNIKTIEQTVQSIIGQSLELIRNYTKKDIRIKYISESDNGIYDAMNKGIKLFKGEIISLLNSDDYYELNALYMIAKYIPARNNYVIYGMVRRLKDNEERFNRVLADRLSS